MKGSASVDGPCPSTVPRWCLGISRVLIHSYRIASVSERSLSHAPPRPNTRKTAALHTQRAIFSCFCSTRYHRFRAPYFSTDSSTGLFLVFVRPPHPQNPSVSRHSARRRARRLPPAVRCLGRQKEGALREGWLRGSCVLPVVGKDTKRVSGGPHRDGLGGEQ